MKRLKSIMIFLLIVALLIAYVPQKEANAATSLPNSIYLAQQGSTTCTLCSATMMLRSRMYLSGNSDWSKITESATRSTAWIDGQGLRWSFTYSIGGSSMTVAHKSVSGISVSSLKSILNNHPEGIVLYCGKLPHAVFLTDYEGDTFYCADTVSSYSGIRRTLGSSYLGKKYGSQATILSNVTAYWYISSYNINGPAPDYCSCSTDYAGSYTCTTTSANLLIRSGHGTSYSSIGSIPPGATVTVTKASGEGAGNWAHVEYNGITGYASMEYLSRQEETQEIDARIAKWISYDQMGDSITSAKVGDWIYLCYRMYDANSGKNLNELVTKEYTVTETIYNPDGSTVHSYTYSNSDNNWIGGGCYTAGTYTYEIVIEGDWYGTYTDTIVVEENPKEIHVSAYSVFLTLGETESTTIYAWSSGYYNGSTNLRWERSNSNISCSWGDLTDGKYPLTITANNEGTATITLSVLDADTAAVLDYVTVDVTISRYNYSISYDANGGSGAPSTQSKAHGTDMTISDTLPTRFGYTFLGWATYSTASSPEYYPGDTFSGNYSCTLYAVWEEATVFDSYAGSIGTTVTVPFSFGYEYYVFTPAHSGTYRFESTGSLDTRIYVFDSNGEELAYNDDSGEGYNFLLEYDLSAGDTYYFKLSLYSAAEGSYEFTMTHICAVTFDANGGSEVPSTQQASCGEALTLSETVPQRFGYTFSGWGTSPTAETAVCLPGQIISLDGDIQLYAIWNPAYTMRSNLGFGDYFAVAEFANYEKYYTFTPANSTSYLFESTGDVDSQIYIYSASEELIASNDDSGENTNFKLEFQVTAGTTYYIKVRLYSSGTGRFDFTARRIYQITYNANGGDFAPDAQQKIYGYDLVLSTETPSRDGFTFVGWSTDVNATSASHLPGDVYGVNDVLTLYAVWERDAVPLTITTQPQDVKVPAGNRATMTVGATGDGLTYEWYYANKGASKFTKSTSVTGNTYTVTMTDVRDGRRVYCVITDQYGNSVRSNTATFTMGKTLKITQQPTSVVVSPGASARVLVGVEGDGMTFKWYFANAGESTFTRTTAFGGNTYTVAMNSARNGRRVYCVITDQYGKSVTTNTVTLNMGNTLKITQQPASVTVAAGATAKVTIGVQGEGLTYKWYYANKGASSFTRTGSFTGNTYSVSMNAARAGRRIYCVITDKYGNSVKTNTVTLGMTSNLKITRQPISTSAPIGGTVNVTVGVQGEGLTYKWYYANKGVSSFSHTKTFSGNTYSTTMTNARAGRRIYCVITDKYGNSVRTNTVTLSMSTPLAITSQPVSVTVAEGKTAKVTVKAAGEGLTYEWYYANAGSHTFTKTNAFTTGSYYITMNAARAGRRVYCVITDQYGNSIFSDTVALNMT